MSLARAVSVIWVAQAFLLTAAYDSERIVRKSHKVVSANGDIMEEKTANIVQTAVKDVSVSATGELSLVDDSPASDMLVDSQSDSQTSRAAELLTEVEQMFEKEALDANDAPRIKVIKDIVNNDILPDLMKDRDTAQTQVNDNIKAIEKCNANSKSTQGTIKGQAEASVKTSRTSHATCREQEIKADTHKNGRCAELDAFLNATNPPATIPTPRDRREMVEYVEKMSSYFCPKGPEATRLDEACKQAEKEHQEHQESCNKKQATFESQFCQWKTELGDACINLKTCYDGAKQAYQAHLDSTWGLIEKVWKIEYKTLKKIVCYTDVWMNNNKENLVDSSQYEKCKNTEADDKVMEIQNGTVPTIQTCDLTPVSISPGTEKFPQTEYSKFAKEAKTPIPCVGTILKTNKVEVQKVEVPYINAGNLGSGLACQDNAKGNGFIMYSEQDVQKRWTTNTPHKQGASHFLCVRFNGEWQYDTNSKWVKFEAAPTDILVAAADFTKDTVADLKGKSAAMYEGMKYGYASGDLQFTANKWTDNMKYAKGEFHVAGKGFTPEASYPIKMWSVGDLGSGIACRDHATGTGYLMYSREDVHKRWTSSKVLSSNAHQFVCVQYSGGWKYDTNGKLVAFTPKSTDVLVAAADYSKDTVTSLEGSSGSVHGITKGYKSGDLVFTANKWSDMRYAKGEFHVEGTGFTP